MSKLTVKFMNFVTECIICRKDLPVTVCTLNQMQHILCYHFSETETKFKFGGSVERALRFHQGSETCTGGGLKPERVVGSGCPGKKVYS